MQDNNLPLYLRPKDVEAKIGITIKTLNELKNTVFKKNIHYFIPTGKTYTMWSTSALIEWIKGDDNDAASNLVNEILNI